MTIDWFLATLGLLLAFALGCAVGYTSGEEHGIIMSMKASCERDAREWDKRSERLGIKDDK